MILKSKTPIFQSAVLLSAPLLGLLFFWFAHYAERSSFLPMAGAYSLLAVWFVLAVCHQRGRIASLRTIFWIGLLFRLLFLGSEPKLSDDYHRFLWDGYLVTSGENPYSITPSQAQKADHPLANAHPSLLEKLNSPDYYSVYPPVNQFLFAASVSIGQKEKQSVLVMRLLLIAAEIAIFYLMILLLGKEGRDPTLVGWYFLNPLVILELTGNLHFEGVMLTFLLAAYLSLRRNKIVLAGLFMGISVSVKLIPVMLVPLLYRVLGWKNWLVFSMVSLLVFLFTWIPFSDWQEIRNMLGSAGLFIQKFEFNASLHYLVRLGGEMISGFNPMIYTGPLFIFIQVLIILWLMLRKSSGSWPEFFKNAAFVMMLYYLLSSIVHPWYTINLLLPAVFIGWKSPVVWTISAFLSYSFYSYGESAVYFICIAMEYILLGVFLYLDLKGKDPENTLS